MIRSLRVRFFLISWPLVVAAIAAVAFGVQKLTTVELNRVEINGKVVRNTIERRGGAPDAAPPGRAGDAQEAVDVRNAALRSRIWSVALFASLAAAAAALLLAGPLVARIRRLTDAAAAIRGGALDTRVSDRSGDEIASLGDSFNAMAAALAQAQQLQRSLVSDVAHELRTPLTNVMGLVEAMQDGLVSPDEATLATLRGEIGLLASLVHELQELSLAESGQLALTVQALDAVAVCDAAVSAIAASANGVIVAGPDGGEPILVRADSQRLAQVLRNLLRNAITHTPAGGRVRVTVERRGTVVVIIVEDTGRGIPAEHLPLVFERFHRVDPSRDRSSGGMGLGLAVVKQFVSAMGGRVWVESEEGRGARFGVELPAA